MNKQEYQEIDLMELIQLVLAKWWLILLLMVIAGGSSYYATKEYVTPVYQAKSTLFIGKESELLAGISLNDFNLDNKLVIDYKELIKTKLVTNKVIDTLALKTSYTELINNMGIQVIDESRFMHVTFKGTVPERTTLIVNAISEVLAEKAQEIVGVDNIMIVDYAEVPKSPISPSLSKNVAIGAALGMMIALGIIFLQMLLNNTINSEEDFEKSFHVTVLGVIPKFRGEVR